MHFLHRARATRQCLTGRALPTVRLSQLQRHFSASASRSAINKICDSAQEAIKDMRGSTTLLVGGFGFSGVPNTLINALRDRPDLKDFTVVSNNAGMPGVGLGE
jgi:3-oxoacid CoA-transferase